MFNKDEVLRGNQVLTIFPSKISQDLKFLSWINDIMTSTRETDFGLSFPVFSTC